MSISLSRSYSTPLDFTAPARRLAVVPAPELSSGLHFSLLQSVVEGLIDGLIIATVAGEIVLSNQPARHLLRQLTGDTGTLPAGCDRLCHALMDSQRQFPQQRVVPELDLTSPTGSLIRVRAQWLHVATPLETYVLLTLEDRAQSYQNLAIADAQQYGLTARETEVWALRHAGLSYKDIAQKLYITHNTVKRHIKNILAKQQEHVVMG